MFKRHFIKFKSVFILILLTFSTSYSQLPFVTTWQVDTSLRIIIPTKGAGYNYTVQWEKTTDPTVKGTSTGNVGDATLTLPNQGVYKVSISGDFPRIYFNNNPGGYNNLLTVEQWGSIAWTSMENAFQGCFNFNITATDAPDLSKVQSMRNMFLFCSKLNAPIGHWNVSNVKDMRSMFCYANTFNQPIGTWDVSNVEDMTLMFQSAGSFNQPIGNWNVSKVKSMYGLFYWPNVFNQDISRWDVSNVTDMSYMFLLNRMFNQDISTWNVGKVTQMSNMFNMATSFNQNLGNWNVANVVSMEQMLDVTAMSRANYDATIQGWTQKSGIQNNVKLGAKGLHFCDAAPTRQWLVDTKGWTIVGDTLKCLVASHTDRMTEESTSISPNPFIDEFHMVLNPSEKVSVEVFNTLGVLVYACELTAEANIINLKNEPSGIYVVKIQSVRGRSAQRMVKQ
ncbi:MAG TPA: BspA family leucine-rich repeat surface protein [Cytophagales bacterium]|nr:BspA family leucine-rich repeat surface protein [Cytophagales bacterium]